MYFVHVLIFLSCIVSYASSEGATQLASPTINTTMSDSNADMSTSTTSDVSHSSFDASVSDHSVDNTKIALPLGTWSILDMDEKQRVSVCSQQTAYCTNDCGGDQVTNLNFCDPKTMNWGCTCQQKIPNSLPFQWPVTVAECNGKEKTCQSGCGEGGQADVCRNLCTGYFKCNRPGSEPSKLRLNATPSNSSSHSSSNSIHTTNPIILPLFILFIVININSNL